MVFNEKATTGLAPGNSRVITTAPSKLMRLSGSNTHSADIWVQLFDLAAVPANGTAPIHEQVAFAGLPYDIDFGIIGKPFANGIVAVASSTAQALTISVAGKTTFNATYY